MLFPGIAKNILRENSYILGSVSAFISSLSSDYDQVQGSLPQIKQISSVI